MTLKDFVQESLTQIIDGAIAAHEAVKAKGGAVNPMEIRTKKKAENADESVGYINEVDFDVALTDAQKVNAEGGIGVLLGGLGLGAKVRKGTEASSLTRIKFTIPIGLPYGRLEKEAPAPRARAPKRRTTSPRPG